MRIQVSFKSDKITEMLHKDMYIHGNISMNSSQNEKFQAEFVEKIKTHIWHSVTSLQKIIAIYDILWKNYGTARHATDDNIKWHMCFAWCYVSKATDTHWHT